MVNQKIGKYWIQRELGKGGMATVYLAQDPQLKRQVAIKIIRTDREQDPVFLKRFELEAKILAKFSHPNVVSVIDYGAHEGCPYLVMEYIPGGALSQIASRPMPYLQAAQILLPIARALAYIHDHKIIHRDIKPANILLTRDNIPMLSDFGIARLIENDETLDLTRTGVGIGTPNYMSPEQAVNRNVDHRADIYSFGMVFYKLITGETPFQADTPYGVLLKQASEPLPSPKKYVPDLPDSVAQVLQKALEKQPEDRFQTMHEFAEALDQLIHGKPVRLKKKSSGKNRKILAYALVGTGLAAVLGMGFFFLRGPAAQAGTDSLPPTEAVAMVTVPAATPLPPTQPPVAPAQPTLTAAPPKPSPTAAPTLASTATLEAVEAWKPVQWNIPASAPAITADNLAQLQPVSALAQNAQAVHAFGLSADFSRLAVDSPDGFSVFDFAQNREESVKTGNPVRLLAVSPDQQQVAAYTSDDRLEIWDLDTNRLVNSFFIGKTGSLLFHSDGKQIYTGSLDGNIRLWQVSDGAQIQTLAGHKSGVSLLQFTPDGKTLISASEDKTIRFWSVADGKEENNFTLHSAAVIALAVSGDGKIVASGAKDGNVHMIDPSTGKVLHSIRLTTEVRDLSFSPDGKILAITLANGQAQFWRVNENTLITTLQPDGNPLAYFRFDPQGTHPLAVGEKEWRFYQVTP